MLKNIQIIWALISNQIKMTWRIRVAAFFSIAMPLTMFFIYTYVFGQGNAQVVPSIIGPLIVLTITGSSLYGIGMQLVTMREEGSLRPYQMTPVKPIHLLLSRLITNYIILLLVISIQLILAFALFHVTPASYALLFITISIGAVSICSIGLLIASLVKSTEEANIINQLTFFAILFLCGLTIPLNSLPKVLREIGLFLPPTHLTIMISMLLEHRPFGLRQAVEFAGMIFSGICFFWDKTSEIHKNHRNIAIISMIPYIFFGIIVNIIK